MGCQKYARNSSKKMLGYRLLNLKDGLKNDYDACKSYEFYTPQKFRKYITLEKRFKICHILCAHAKSHIIRLHFSPMNSLTLAYVNEDKCR